MTEQAICDIFFSGSKYNKILAGYMERNEYGSKQEQKFIYAKRQYQSEWGTKVIQALKEDGILWYQ